MWTFLSISRPPEITFFCVFDTKIQSSLSAIVNVESLKDDSLPNVYWTAVCVSRITCYIVPDDSYWLAQ